MHWTLSEYPVSIFYQDYTTKENKQKKTEETYTEHFSGYANSTKITKVGTTYFSDKAKSTEKKKKRNHTLFWQSKFYRVNKLIETVHISDTAHIPLR